MYVQSSQVLGTGHWSHSCWQTSKLKAFPAGSQEHMIIQLICRVLETAAHTKPFHSFWERRQHVFCATPAYVCVCVHAGKSQMPTEPLKQNFLTCRTHSCALATAYQHKTQSSHFNFSHWFWALGQGVLTFYNTHVCVRTDQPS